MHFIQLCECAYFARYIDDGFAVVRDEQASDLREKINSWHTSIRVPEKDFNKGKTVHFLDLEVHMLPSGHVYFKTYRKPQSIFDYIPPNSSHPRACFDGMVQGEVNRLLTTNTFPNDFNKQLHFFRTKLVRRGYSLAKIRSIFSKNQHYKRYQLLARNKRGPVQTVQKDKVFGHGLYHFPGVQNVKLKKQNFLAGRQLNMYAGQCRVRSYYKIRPNIFLRLYPASWKPKHACLVAG